MKRTCPISADISEQEVPFLTFKILSGVPGLVHGVFTRHGGVSKPPYESLNVSWSNGDDPASVAENLTRIRNTLGLRKLASSRQVHGDTIHFIDGESATAVQPGNDVSSRMQNCPPLLVAPSGDALATGTPGIGLVIKVADCQSVMLLDPETRIIANIHNGWRGSVQNIAAKTVEYLRSRLACDPSRMLAAVSPSLGPCCAEFVNYTDELPPEMWSMQVRPNYFDFWAITRKQLTSAGVRDENIEFSARCTVCQKADFFSYRGERVTGRMAAVIGWRETQ